jgi:hypothetical protein
MFNSSMEVVESWAQSTDLKKNFLTELMFRGQEKCIREIYWLNMCLLEKSEGNGLYLSSFLSKTQKVISTAKVSVNTQVKQDVSDKNVDLEDCKKIQVDLGNCIVKNNRFHPCEPLPIELLNQNTLNLRKYELDKIMEAAEETVVRYRGEDGPNAYS